MWIKKKEKNLKNKNFPKHEKFSKNLKKLQKRNFFLKKFKNFKFQKKMKNFQKNVNFKKMMKVFKKKSKKNIFWKKF